MHRNNFRFVAGMTFVIVVVAACSSTAPQSNPSTETLGAAIRDSGLKCAEALSAEVIPERASTWRVICSESFVYAATLGEDGRLCVEPILAAGFSEDLILPPDPHCAPLPRAR